MARSYAEYAASRRAQWSDDTRDFADKAAAMFAAQVEAHRAFGNDLAAARKAAHLTQDQLEALSTVPQPEISRIERGVGNPTAETITKLISPLGVRLALVPVEGRTPQHA